MVILSSPHTHNRPSLLVQVWRKTQDTTLKLPHTHERAIRLLLLALPLLQICPILHSPFCQRLAMWVSDLVSLLVGGLVWRWRKWEVEVEMEMEKKLGGEKCEEKA